MVPSIKPISKLGNLSSDETRDNFTEKKDNSKNFSNQKSLTERAMGAKNNIAHDAAYFKEANLYLLYLYRVYGPIIDSYVKLQTDFFICTQSNAEKEKLAPLRSHIHNSSTSFKNALKNELELLKRSGLDENSAKVDALIGLDHLFGTSTAPLSLYNDMLVRATSEQKPMLTLRLQESMSPLTEMYENLATLNAHVEKTDYFLFSLIKSKHADEMA